MRTSTEFKSKISVPSIFTSFDSVRDLVKGRFSDVYRFMSKCSSDYYVLFSDLAIDASCMRLMHTRTDFSRCDTT